MMLELIPHMQKLLSLNKSILVNLWDLMIKMNFPNLLILTAWVEPLLQKGSFSWIIIILQTLNLTNSKLMQRKFSTSFL